MSRIRHRRYALVAAAALGLAACGGSDSQQAATGNTGTATPTSEAATLAPDEPTTAAEAPTAGREPEDTGEAAPAGPNQLPQVTVLDIATGEEVELDSFAPADKAIVLWLWAPH